MQISLSQKNETDLFLFVVTILKHSFFAEENSNSRAGKQGD